MRSSDWSSDVCSSDLPCRQLNARAHSGISSTGKPCVVILRAQGESNSSGRTIMSMTFSGQVALVTGAAAGIGRATAQAFAEQGLKVVLADIDEAGIRDGAESIRAAGGQAIAVRCDVTRDAEVQALIEQTLAQSGRLDYAFNNAGIEIEQGRPAGGSEDRQ